MALILCKSGSSIGWRDESSTSGYQKLMRNGANVGWRLNQDAGIYLFKDGASVGWRNKTFITISILSTSINYMATSNLFSQYLIGDSIGNRTWSISAGSLPSGITLSAAGLLYGTPTRAGSYSFTVSMSADGQTVTKTFLAVVNESSLTSVSNVIFQSKAASTDINISCQVGERLVVFISSNGSIYEYDPTLQVAGWTKLSSDNGSGINAILYTKIATSSIERFACTYNSSWKQGTILFTYRFSGNILGHIIARRFSYADSQNLLNSSISCPSSFSRLLIFAHVRGHLFPSISSLSPSYTILDTKSVGPFADADDINDRTIGTGWILAATGYNANASIVIPKKNNEDFSIGIYALIATN